jgi:hypothetical protein
VPILQTVFDFYQAPLPAGQQPVLDIETPGDSRSLLVHHFDQGCPRQRYARIVPPNKAALTALILNEV